MRPSELQAILQSNKKYSVAEIQNIISELIYDAIREVGNCIDENEKRQCTWYQGEINGFNICQDLLEHLEV